MRTHTVSTKSPRPRDLYHFQGKNAARDARRYLARYIRETGDTSARILATAKPRTRETMKRKPRPAPTPETLEARARQDQARARETWGRDDNAFHRMTNPYA